jgi:hypothetical protein
MKKACGKFFHYEAVFTRFFIYATLLTSGFICRKAETIQCWRKAPQWGALSFLMKLKISAENR